MKNLMVVLLMLVSSACSVTPKPVDAPNFFDEGPAVMKDGSRCRKAVIINECDTCTYTRCTNGKFYWDTNKICTIGHCALNESKWAGEGTGGVE